MHRFTFQHIGKTVLLFFILAGAYPAQAALPDRGPSVAELDAAILKLRPLCHPKARPKPGEWLSLHREEGQTFHQYLASHPIRPQGERCVLYIQPVGGFSSSQKRIVELTSEFVGLYFNLPVRTLPALSLSGFPPKARRFEPGTGYPQILTSYVLEDVLRPRFPKDAVALLAFTAYDLWPRDGWKFVFGEASIQDRVGVWSIYRYGDPAVGDAAFRLCLLRSIATASHETGHMFSLLHCTKYECNMNGSESLEESDRQPLALCPECLAKICWVTRTQPLDHLTRLAEFCQRNGLRREEAIYRESIRALSGASGQAGSRAYSR